MNGKCTIRVAKTKVLISFAVTAKLICIFVFAYADCWFSYEAAQTILILSLSLKNQISNKNLKRNDYKMQTNWT